MTKVKQEASATLIGDIVGSREASDRSVLHARLQDALREGNARWHPVTTLRITAGDEFQGTFASVGQAIQAALWLRLAMLPASDLRHGIGWGAVTILDSDQLLEDGPGWWAARAAIEEIASLSRRPGYRLLRTRYAAAGGQEGGPDVGAVNAALMCRDQLIGIGDERTWRLLRGFIDGASQSELAASEQISPSAISQRVRNDGLAVMVAAQTLLAEVS